MHSSDIFLLTRAIPGHCFLWKGRHLPLAVRLLAAVTGSALQTTKFFRPAEGRAKNRIRSLTSTGRPGSVGSGATSVSCFVITAVGRRR